MNRPLLNNPLTFQIWGPTAFEKFKLTARKKANINRSDLKWELQNNKQ